MLILRPNMVQPWHLSYQSSPWNLSPLQWNGKLAGCVLTWKVRRVKFWFHIHPNAQRWVLILVLARTRCGLLMLRPNMVQTLAPFILVKPSEPLTLAMEWEACRLGSHLEGKKSQVLVSHQSECTAVGFNPSLSPNPVWLTHVASEHGANLGTFQTSQARGTSHP